GEKELRDLVGVRDEPQDVTVLPAVNESEPVPTAREVLAEAALLGAMLAEAWWKAAGRVTELAVVEPARAASHLASFAASRIGESSLSAGVAPRRPARSRPAGPDDRLRGDLRQRGAELLRRSADVAYEQEQHPAYMRILDQMAPDEA